MKPVWDLKSQAENYLDQDVFDCLLAEYILSEGKHPLTESAIFEIYNVTSLEALAPLQQAALEKSPELASLFYDIELPLAKVIWQMEQNGIYLDQVYLQKVGAEITKQTTDCVTEIQ